MNEWTNYFTIAIMSITIGMATLKLNTACTGKQAASPGTTTIHDGDLKWIQFKQRPQRSRSHQYERASMGVIIVASLPGSMVPGFNSANGGGDH